MTFRAPVQPPGAEEYSLAAMGHLPICCRRKSMRVCRCKDEKKEQMKNQPSLEKTKNIKKKPWEYWAWDGWSRKQGKLKREGM
jgi:hypothetical protein